MKAFLNISTTCRTIWIAAKPSCYLLILVGAQRSHVSNVSNLKAVCSMWWKHKMITPWNRVLFIRLKFWKQVVRLLLHQTRYPPLIHQVKDVLLNFEIVALNLQIGSEDGWIANCLFLAPKKISILALVTIAIRRLKFLQIGFKKVSEYTVALLRVRIENI